MSIGALTRATAKLATVGMISGSLVLGAGVAGAAAAPAQPVGVQHSPAQCYLYQFDAIAGGLLYYLCIHDVIPPFPH